MFADYHVHSEFSWDSRTPMEAQIQAAVRAGVEELCFTEHVDYGARCGEDNCDYSAYKRELERCRAIYGNQIRLKYGIEFGVQTHTIGEYERDFREQSFDFVILSCHQVDNLEFDNQAYQRGKTQREYNEGYYSELLKVIRSFDRYSVLGHLDLMRRYDRNGPWPFENSRPILEQILSHVIERGKGIEVNTSCFRYRIGDLTPSEDILRLYRDMGGKILTLGSDAHRPEQIAGQFPFVRRRLRELGFRELCAFHQMEPEFYPL